MNRLTEEWEKLLASLNEQEWYQEARQRWDDLDTQSKLYAKLGMIASAVIGSFVVIFMVISAVTETKRSFVEKSDLLDFLQAAGDEMKALKATTGRAAPAGGKPQWKQHFSGVAGSAGLTPENFTVGQSKTGKKTEVATEILYDISFSKVSIKQVVRFGFYLEHGIHPVKLRHMKVLTKDAEGYLDAVMAVSAFELKPKEQ